MKMQLSPVLGMALATLSLVITSYSPSAEKPEENAQKPLSAYSMLNNEPAAINACKIYAEAQDIYRRTDWDNDAILEYAQSISGNCSLYERNEGKGDLSLVDSAFAKAEGTPVEIKEADIPRTDEATKKALSELIPKLASESFQEREDCSKAIVELGAKAITEVESKIRETVDAEVRARLKAAALKLRGQLWAQSFDKGSRAIPRKGYCFKVLTGQGLQAPGGQKTYISAGNMTLGYALVAFPAVYGKTGKHTFIINNMGTVYKKDLGEKTIEVASKMNEYNPSEDWMVTE